MVNKPTNERELKVKSFSKEELKANEAAEAKKKSRLESFKIFIAVVLLVAGVAGYYIPNEWFGPLPGFVRALFPVVGVVVALAIVFFWCDFGRNLTAYVRDSISEIKKVVWPERSDAIKQTLFVALFVMILALFIWLADSGITWLFYNIILGRG
jgi:preprotein translocase subunit SecE